MKQITPNIIKVSATKTTLSETECKKIACKTQWYLANLTIPINSLRNLSSKMFWNLL